MVVLGAQVEQPADLQRHVLGGRFLRVAGPLPIAGVVRPRHLQRADVLRRDVGERRIALTVSVAPVGGPVVAARRVRRRGGGSGRRGQPTGDVEAVARHRGEPDQQHEQRHHAEAVAGRVPARARHAGCALGGGRQRVRPRPERARDPWRQQPQPDQPEQRQARRERPAVQPGLEQRPDEREQQRRRIHPQRQTPARDQQAARHHPAGTEDDVGPGVAERGQPHAAGRQQHAEQQQDPSGHHRSHESLRASTADVMTIGQATCRMRPCASPLAMTAPASLAARSIII